MSRTLNTTSVEAVAEYPVAVETTDPETGEPVFVHFLTKGAADLFATLVEDTGPNSSTGGKVKRWVSVEGTTEWREVSYFNV